MGAPVQIIEHMKPRPCQPSQLERHKYEFGEVRKYPGCDVAMRNVDVANDWRRISSQRRVFAKAPNSNEAPSQAHTFDLVVGSKTAFLILSNANELLLVLLLLLY